MQSPHLGRRRPARKALGNLFPTGGLQPRRRRLLFALVVGASVGCGVLFAADGARGAEPDNKAATAGVRVVESLDAAALGNQHEGISSPQSVCPSGRCRPLDRAPEAGPVPTSSPPSDEGNKTDQGSLHLTEARSRRLREAGDRRLGLRILDPLYATLAVPSHPAWSPEAERPAEQRFLVGFSFFVPF